jgi:hypothetical protein
MGSCSANGLGVEAGGDGDIEAELM